MTNEEFAESIELNFEDSFKHMTGLFCNSISNFIFDLYKASYPQAMTLQLAIFQHLHDKIFQDIQQSCKNVCTKKSIVELLNESEKDKFKNNLNYLKMSCENNWIYTITPDFGKYLISEIEKKNNLAN